MRILHTSDWHLGVSTGPESRAYEQRLFLEWLLGVLRDERVDALIVAGDVFDTMHPSSEAQAIYYRFLAQVADTGTRDVVVVGGNHDSGARLEAPKALLNAIGVHVVGGVPAAGERGAQMVVPLRARGPAAENDAVAAVCLAVPYVHEYRLGIRTTDLDRDATRAAFRDEFSALYSGLADHAAAAYPGVPLIATGHLTLGTGSSRQDYPQEIHQVGTLEGLPAEILDPRVSYTALGHIHRCYRAHKTDAASAWYSGSPIAYSMAEMGCDRRVLLVDIDGDSAPRVVTLTVPRSRDLLQLTGTADAVLADLAALSWVTSLPPLVHIRVETQLADPGLTHRLHEVIPTGDKGERPVLVEVRQGSELAPAAGLGGDVLGGRELRAMEPGEVFDLMCEAKQLDGLARESLQAAFATVAQAKGADFEALLAATQGQGQGEVAP